MENFRSGIWQASLDFWPASSDPTEGGRKEKDEMSVDWRLSPESEEAAVETLTG